MMMMHKKLELDRVYTEEAALLKAVINWLTPQQREGIRVLRICDRYAKGYSDLFICVRGVFVCAELKDDSGTATQHQKLFLKQMEEAGAICGICRTVSDVSTLVEKAKEVAKHYDRAGQTYT